MKPYYEADGITIYHGDCRDVLWAHPEIKARTTVTSPPYNTLGSRIPDNPTGLMAGNKWLAKVSQHGYADDMSEDEYAEWQRQVAAMVLVSTVPGGSFFYNHKIRYRDRAPVHPLDLVRGFDGWDLRQEIVWDRRGAMALNARMFAPCDERIYWLVRPGEDYVWNQDELAMSVWPIVPDNDPGGKHPCPYPLAIPARCIAATTRPGDLVLDQFMGSGTTLRAAKNLGRRAVGIDVDERYCELAAERLGQMVLDIGGSTSCPG